MNKRKRKKHTRKCETSINTEEILSLDITIAKFIVPRLKLFRKREDSCPLRFENEQEWYDILDKMIKAFEHLTKCSSCISTDDPDWKDKEKIRNNEIKEGLNLFAEYYRALWI